MTQRARDRRGARRRIVVPWPVTRRLIVVGLVAMTLASASGAPLARRGAFRPAAVVCAPEEGGDPTEGAYDLNERAVEAIARGETARAAELLERALALSPESGVIRNNLAEARFRLGADACDAERYRDALAELLESIRLRGDRAKAHVFLGVAHYRLFDHVEAVAAFERAIEIDAEDPSAHENMGHVLYARSEPSKALAAWKRALRLGSSTSDLPDLVRRVEREIEVESRFATSRTAHFDVRHDPSIPREALEVVHGAVERAWVRVGRALDAYPEGAVPVIVYTRSGFSKVTKGHRWVAGLFDGRIRIPVDRDADGDSLVDTIAHEYTHYVIHRIAPRCPPWLHEGIAQWVEGRRGLGRERLAREARAGKLPRMFGMTRSFAETGDAARARRLYEQALAFVEFLAEREGPTAPGRLMRALATEELESAIETATGTDSAELEAEWIRSLGRG